MAISFDSYRPEHEPAVIAFNRRIQVGGAPPDYAFPESHVPPWLPETNDTPVYNKFYLALDDDVVRGTYALKFQRFSIAGEERDLTFYHHPFSEGIVDKKYTSVGILLLRDALRRHPLTFALGMGGYDRPLPQMLITMKWHHFGVPFLFRVRRSRRVLRNLGVFRQSRSRSVAAAILAGTGLGPLGIHAVQRWRSTPKQSLPNDWKPETVESFEPWADEVWESSNAQYAMVGARDSATLSTLFPESNPRIVRVRVTWGGKPRGWAVVATREYSGHPQWGNLRVGVLLDIFGAPDDALPIATAAVSELERKGADLIVSNQSHPQWCSALERLGFWRGPTNFIFAAPPKLWELVEPHCSARLGLHLTRADGDGLYQYR